MAEKQWIPACAGMTLFGAKSSSKKSAIRVRSVFDFCAIKYYRVGIGYIEKQWQCD